MTLSRRDFLSSSLSAGALLAAAAALASPPDTAPEMSRLILLRNPGDASFAQSVRATCAALGLASPVQSPLVDALALDSQSLARHLDAWRGARLVGLLDDCSHTLIEEAIRDRGGVVWCRGIHATMFTHAGPSRHRFATGPQSQGLGHAFVEALCGAGADFEVEEVALHPAQAIGRGSRLAAAPWPQLLGVASVLIAAGRWHSGAALAAPRRARDGGQRARRLFASLVAAI
jgi:hypothetical protein